MYISLGKAISDKEVICLLRIKKNKLYVQLYLLCFPMFVLYCNQLVIGIDDLVYDNSFILMFINKLDRIIRVYFDINTQLSTNWNLQRQ